ncbi:hypothetical protein AB0R75_03005 [Bacillus pumilus]|uniref:hypothetical protein n=1 Tax=Bacillus TaxID=1386 RepID=UPI001B3A74D7|nr:hypothetical protein [Bacillus pumilus]MBQ4816960.1 hypothetical protein [Bacillus pumilus]WIG32670.1 hypothetical protein QPL77_03080 [Bacillus pumilus]
MKGNTWIEGWFEKCEELKIKPWEWDFKQSYIKEPIPKDKSSIELILDYKSRTLKEIGICNVTKKTGRKADCDKEPFYIYQLLWSTEYEPKLKSQLSLDRHNSLRGETMNSFITTFNHSKKINSDSHLKLEFEKFATSTHCIGNFTVLPHWMNSGRYLFSQDYWDVTMYSLFEFFQPLGCWKQFVERYFLQPYVNNDEEWTVSEFWEGHFESIGNYNQLKPQNEQELSEYLHKVNLRIEERGKWIIKKVCEELKLQHFTFYDELKDRQIRFSNEMK